MENSWEKPTVLTLGLHLSFRVLILYLYFSSNIFNDMSTHPPLIPNLPFSG